MALYSLKRTALVFAVFNLAGIPFLAWALKPAFNALYDMPSQWMGIALSFVFVISVICVNALLSMNAYRIDSRSPLTWIMIVWTIIVAVSGVAASALDIWSMLGSLSVFFQMNSSP